ncbi:MAG: Gfo/Idh/MocA family oxidoreductase [Candidatus Rokubacteria bacterium]|nr:Gfo/Idh/MocA family oxidoreductase [Candidatus Rokubacteria bacterium]
MPSKLRVGVIGTGFGSTVQIPAFQAHPRVEVAALASGQPGKARAVADRFGIPHAFDAWADLAKAELDLVSITAPPWLHHPMTLAALGAGRHVLCEKPMALSAAEALEMLETAERARVVHLIDHELRFNPNRRKVRALIADGFVGRPRHVLITQVGPGRSDPTRPWTWWSDASRGGGLLGALGTHQIDLLRYWLGEIEAVSGAVEVYVKQRPVEGGAHRAVTAEDFTSFSLRFASGAVGTVVLSAVTAHPRGPRLEVWGEEGTLYLDEAERLWGARRGRDLEELTERETLAPPSGMEYPTLWGLGFVRLVDHVVAALLDGGPVAPAATFRDGLQVQRAMDAIREAARSGWARVPAPPV